MTECFDLERMSSCDGLCAADAAKGSGFGRSHGDAGTTRARQDHRPLWYRVTEIAAAAAALVVASPVLVVVALLIKLDSPGPVLFAQRRVGRDARPFTFLKLRTMYADGNTRFPHLSPQALGREATAQLRLQLDDDPRVTRIGRFLRRTSIDEIPNFWHVMTGDMALVGPRPEMVEILPHYTGEQLVKFSVPPGITGYAQICGRGDLTFLETLEHDLRYVRSKSLGVDLDILWKTVGCVLSGKGAW